MAAAGLVVTVGDLLAAGENYGVREVAGRLVGAAVGGALLVPGTTGIVAGTGLGYVTGAGARAAERWGDRSVARRDRDPRAE
jgi:hypothetical protein